MSIHTIKDAKSRLDELIARAYNGEDVVISAEGGRAVELKPISDKSTSRERPVTKADIEWLDSHRVGDVMPKEDAGTFVSRMRDEDWR